MNARSFAPAAALPLLLPAACGGSGDHTTAGAGGSTSSTTATTTTTGTTGGTGGAMQDPAAFVTAPASCAYQCPLGSCPEQTAPYACQDVLPWSRIPHASTCEAWDGTYPKPVQGKCTATAPAGDAVKYVGPDPASPGTLVMPGGRRLSPAGADFVFPDPADMINGAVAVPGTSLVVTVDLGNGDHIVRSVDVTQIGVQSPTRGQVNFANPEALNQGLAFSPPDRVYVASAQGVVQALALDTATGALTRDDARSIQLPSSPQSPNGTFWSSGVAVSNDDTRLYVSGAKDTRFVVADVTAGGAGYGAILGDVDLGSIESYAVYVDPHDPATHFAYVTMWAKKSVIEIDVSDATAPTITRTFGVEKNPQGVAFLDGRWMAVGNDLGDSISLVDRASGSVKTIPVEPGASLMGLEPSSLAWDATGSRLWVTQAGYDALAGYDVDLTQAPPTVSPAGRLPTQWWPSAVVPLPDGSLVVTSLMGRGTGPNDPDTGYGLLHGGVQHVPAPTAADLTAGESAVVKNTTVSAQPGYATVSCPPGADDFPIPSTNTGKPSAQIDHVFLVVRENKTFDGLMGDLAGVKGDPTLTLKPSSQMDGIWTNLRKIARTFAHSDNFYTPAFISVQGHLWTTHGRTDDYNEREWTVTGYGRNLRPEGDSGGVVDLGRPAEGSLFDWLGTNGVPYDLLGEIVGSPATAPAIHDPFDLRYPGGIVQNIGYPDVEKGCYVAGRARVLCDLGNLTYMTLPNDHTQGLSPDTPTPETMFAVNDEATGILVDGLSHSPLWKSTLVIVVEDDPAQGEESVDYHRTILVMASPWLKHGYVSHALTGVASVHKLIAHIFALPYPNLIVEAASLPLDMFTSTPDYTPYTYEKRTYALACGDNSTHAERRLTASWDMDEPDEQPGLDAQVMRWLRGKQLTELPPALEAEVARREARRAIRPDD